MSAATCRGAFRFGRLVAHAAHLPIAAAEGITVAARAADTEPAAAEPIDAIKEEITALSALADLLGERMA
jgi:hypothetical protein